MAGEDLTSTAGQDEPSAISAHLGHGRSMESESGIDDGSDPKSDLVLEWTRSDLDPYGKAFDRAANWNDRGGCTERIEPLRVAD
jgi:hypothetical protein